MSADDATQVNQQQVNAVNGQTVYLSQSSAEHVDADKVELTRSVARVVSSARERYEV